MQARAFESFVVGEQVTSYGRTVTEADIVAFTGLAGLRLPVFIDDEWCRRNTPYGGRIAPGLMTAAFAVGMMEDVLGGNTLAALALDEFRFLVPVRPGDTLHAEVQVTAKRDTSDGKRGILSLAVRVFNQRSEHAMGFAGTFLMRKEAT
jgi:acyl dehydratase